MPPFELIVEVRGSALFRELFSPRPLTEDELGLGDAFSATG